MFEKAARLGLRFDTAKGQLSVEDLWRLPLSSRNSVNLDDIARELHKVVNSEQVSFVSVNAKDEIAQLKFDIVKHIIDVRLAENKAKLHAQEMDAQREKILAQLAKLEDQEFASKSKEELLKALQDINSATAI